MGDHSDFFATKLLKMRIYHMQKKCTIFSFHYKRIALKRAETLRGIFHGQVCQIRRMQIVNLVGSLTV